MVAFRINIFWIAEVVSEWQTVRHIFFERSSLFDRRCEAAVTYMNAVADVVGT